MSSRSFFRKNNKKITEITNRFAGFPNVNITRVECWLDNFKKDDKKVAIKILDNLEYFDASRIYQASKELLTQIKGLKNNDLSKVYFCNLDGPGKSGEYITYQFRVANNLSGSQHNKNFISLRDIPSLLLEGEATIFFLEDFIGTGNQAVEQWSRINEIVPENFEVFLGVVAAFKKGIDNVHAKTRLKVLCYKYLDRRDMVFSDENTKFTSTEKEIIKAYCDKTGVVASRGYGKCQALVVFPNRTPNNSLPILGIQKSTWSGLFPRYPSNN